GGSTGPRSPISRCARKIGPRDDPFGHSQPAVATGPADPPPAPPTDSAVARAAPRDTRPGTGWTVECLMRHHASMWVKALGVLAIVLLWPVPGAAQVYRWDDDGTVNFTNRYERIPEPLRGQVDAPDPAAEEAPEPAPTEAPGTTRIPFTPGSPI